jgi:multidrug efflux pump
MHLSDLALRRPVFAWVANLLILVVGVWSLTRLPVRQYPDIDPPVVSVRTEYVGASSAVVESEITKRIEEAVAGVQGVRSISSTSRDGNSSVDIEFEIGRDIEFASADVRDQIARVQRSLPEDALDPVIEKASSSSAPMMWIALRSDARNALELTDFARRELIDALSVVPGVARIQIGGERRYAMRVWLDPERMAAHGVTASEIAARLEAENLELPGGRLESSTREMTVRADARLARPEQFAGLILRVGAGGEVRLGDVARIELGAASYRTGLYIAGQPAVGMGVVRQSTANTLEVAQGVRAALQRLAPSLPADITTAVPYDESVFIQASIDSVLQTLVEAIVLVGIVILVFLRAWGATLIPMLAVPVSLAAALPVMAALGFSVNVLTLLAFVLAIGLVVDDAIVVLENGYRRLEGGEPRALAAARGTRQVAFAVIATTVVLVAVFVPISFQTGRVGRLFMEFGITLAAAVIGSSFVALTLTPVLCRSLLHRHDHDGVVSRGVGAALSGLENAYRTTLDLALRWKLAVIVVFLAFCSAAVLLFGQVRSELAPVEDQGAAIVVVELPQGATMDETLVQMRRIIAIAEPYSGPDGPVERVLSIVPGFSSPGAVNAAFIILRFKDWSQRSTSQMQVVRELGGKLRGLNGCFAFAINRPSFGIRDFGQSLQAVVGAEDHERARAYAAQLAAVMRASGRFGPVREEVELTKPQLSVEVDRDRMAALGLTASDVGDALAIAFGERKASTIEDRGQQYDVILQVEADRRQVPGDLDRIQVRSRTTGQLIPVSAVVASREEGVPKELKRVDRRAAVTIGTSLPPGSTIGDGVATVSALAARDLPSNAALTWAGAAKEFVDTSGGQTLMFAAALLIVFLALAAQFESWIHPAIIIVTVPLATTGALAALALTGQTNNIYSQIGAVMLIGLVAKNGILMVEFANQLRELGRDIHQAAREAALVRLRPILMTSIAMVAGAIPLAIHGGAGSEARQAIGTVIIGGLTLSTLLTLYIIPVLYILVARYAKPANHHADELARLETEHPESRTGAD